jgi:hypothetical protein
VDVGILGEVLPGWIIRDIKHLIVKIVHVSDAVFVIAGVPDFIGAQRADRV